MAESISQQLVTAVVADLAAIVGDGGENYWYTPAKVIRTDALSQKDIEAVAGHKTVYFVLPDSVESRPWTTCRRRGFITLDLFLFQSFAGGDDSFYQPTPDRGTIQSRMSRDVQMRLTRCEPSGSWPADPYQRLEVFGSDPVRDDRTAEATHLAGFVVAYLPWQFQFAYSAGTP